MMDWLVTEILMALWDQEGVEQEFSWKSKNFNQL